ncbi:kinetochore protein CHL4 like-domain-containing protein [Jimgerdemannia flammicorona]|uniref:Kinetochore protein CHL4 like-domain-containing protein n=2 Tax=Jimgerdemannia flammicorona TaxID=994334 RepID=A0A433PYD8_9FUNG|nr:kinetochore protein CHL4 like-domain-containing protein [Jimgerdemannia flammicorona]
MFSCARIFFITVVVLHIINDGPRDFHKEIASRSSAHVYNNLAMLSHLIPHSPALRRHVNRHTKDSLLAIIEAWFADPETTPPQPELDDEDDESEEGPATFDAYEPIKGNKKRIVERLERDWHVHIAPDPENSTIWIRIVVHDGVAPTALPPAGNVVYLVHFPNSEYLLCGGSIKAEIKAYVVQVLLRVFHATDLDEQDLQGRQIRTLSQLLLHRDSQGPWSRYRLDQVDANPLDYHGKLKRTRLGEETSGREETYVLEEERDRIVPEEREVVEGRLAEVGEKFGWNVVNGVEKVDVKLALPFHETPTSLTDFTMHIRFEGPNVMEGIRRLIPLGVAVAPLPEWLVEMPSVAANKIVVGRDGIVIKGM